MLRRVLCLGGLLAAALTVGCDLVPSKPEAVFVLYRDRMKSEQLDKARDLLSDTSKSLSLDLTKEYKLRQLPENLALLNVLDPVTPPTVAKTEDTFALLQVRTLKGGVRLVRLTRENPNASWKIDISEELRALQTFLGARSALDTVREQAGEYAASWKAFTDHLSRMKVPDPKPEKKIIDSKKRKSSSRSKRKSIRSRREKSRASFRRGKQKPRRSPNSRFRNRRTTVRQGGRQ